MPNSVAVRCGPSSWRKPPAMPHHCSASDATNVQLMSLPVPWRSTPSSALPGEVPFESYLERARRLRERAKTEFAQLARLRFLDAPLYQCSGFAVVAISESSDSA